MNKETETTLETGVTPLTDNTLQAVTKSLKSFTPRTKAESIKMLHFLSAVTNKTTLDKVKGACKDFLENRCKEGCENFVDMESGLMVSKHTREVKVYHDDTEEIKELRKRLKELEDANFSHVVETYYYKTGVV